MHISISRWLCCHQRTCIICVYSRALRQIRILHRRPHATWVQTSYPSCPLSFLLHSNETEMIINDGRYNKSNFIATSMFLTSGNAQLHCFNFHFFVHIGMLHRDTRVLADGITHLFTLMSG